MSSCKSSIKRRKREARWQERLPKRRKKRSQAPIIKRDVQEWSYESAREFCNNYMRRSPVYGLCGEVPNAAPELSLETCILDVILSQSTVWSDNAINLMQGSCMNEIQRNNTLREEPRQNQSEPNLAETIQENTCPGLCSGNGKCDNGTCICDVGFGFDDCSLDISEPPEIFGLLDDGLCDEREVPCTEALVHGETFTAMGELTCDIRPFLMPHDSGKRIYKDAMRIQGQLDTLYDMFCPVNGNEIYDNNADPLAPNESSIIGFTISVSNDGIHFGENVDLYLYDSACVFPHIQEDDKYEFQLETHFCLINRRCVADGVLSDSDPCLMCDRQHNQYNWTERLPEDCVPTTTTTTTSSTSTTSTTTQTTTSEAEADYNYNDYYDYGEEDSDTSTTSSTTTPTSTTSSTTTQTSTTSSTTTPTSTTSSSTTPTSTTSSTTTPTSTTSSTTKPTSTTSSTTTPTSTTSSKTKPTSTTSSTTTPTSTTSSTTKSTSTTSSTTTLTSTTSSTTTPTSTSSTTTPTSSTSSTTTPTSTTSSTTPTSTTSLKTTPTSTTSSTTTPTSTTSSTTTPTSTTSSTTTHTSTTSSSTTPTSVTTPTTTTTPTTRSGAPNSTAKATTESTIPSTSTIQISTTSRTSKTSTTTTTETSTTSRSPPTTSTNTSTTKTTPTTTSTNPTTKTVTTTKEKDTVSTNNAEHKKSKTEKSYVWADGVIASLSGVAGIIVLCLVVILLFRLCAKFKKSRTLTVSDGQPYLDDQAVTSQNTMD